MAANKMKKATTKAKTKKSKVKAAPKKAAPKKATPKKATPKKATPKKAAPKKKATPKAAVKKTPAKKVTSKNLKKNRVTAKVAVAPTKNSAKTTASKFVHSTKANSNFAKVFSPLDDRILVDTIPSETVTAGGLIIPDSAQEKQSRGIVVAVGPGRRNKKAMLRPLDVQLGDEVIYTKFSGTAIEILGKEVLILREEDVLGILNK